ncbi:MAG: flagellar basal-body rod protein FlgG [Planctomycetes bacterium TMED75]|nr:flagellar basal-body rod protein FlgG [Planctomycetaceae bacterium]OUU90508.1 MAG: flagellar basal-body rod protein FlgG [Planctomycetes bacterium TMED75]
MSTISLNTASTGLNALSTNLDVIANNLANVNTTGFRGSRANFEDLFYLDVAQPGIEEDYGTPNPTGLQVGLGVQLSGTTLDVGQGSLEPTADPFDLAIMGDGWFQVEVPPGTSMDGYGYTRAGDFTRNQDGQVIMSTNNGYMLEPSITIPSDAINTMIDEFGNVQYQEGGGVVNAGQITLARFVNPAGLQAIGGNVYVPTYASGDAEISEANIDGYGAIKQNFLESANVEPVTELVSLIKTQRAFEMNSQVIQAANETLQEIVNLRRF